eukprot:240318-Lingulodinium_polyedra.AAC.1
MFGQQLGVSDLGPGQRTPLRVGLLEGWRAAARDPDVHVIRWLRDGAPGGLRELPEHCGVFPTAAEDDVGDAEELQTNFEDYHAYKGVEEDDGAWEQIQEYVAKGWILRFDTLAEARNFLGEDPVLSKFGQVIRTKGGKTKRRIILDSKVSSVSQCSRK